MENVRAIFVDVNAFDVLTIDISAQMRPLVDHEATFAGLMCLISESGTEETGADDEIMIINHFFCMSR